MSSRAGCGEGHGVFVDEENSLWVVGANSMGQLGLTLKSKTTCTPLRNPNFGNIRSVSCGEYHTACVDYEGHVYTFGHNGRGQLGNGRKGRTSRAHLALPNLPFIYSVFCGGSYTCLLDDSFTMWSFGSNHYGELCLGYVGNDEVLPKEVTRIRNITWIACGEEHTILITPSKVYGCGRNSRYQLGVDDDEVWSSPREIHLNATTAACGSYHSVFITDDGVYSCGINTEGQVGRDTHPIRKCFLDKVNFPEKTKIKQISCGNNHTLCVDTYGNLWSFGKNSQNQQLTAGSRIMTPTKHTDIQQVKFCVAGGNHTKILDNDNSIWVRGDNIKGQLGLGDCNQGIIFAKMDCSNIWCEEKLFSHAKSARK